MDIELQQVLAGAPRLERTVFANEWGSSEMGYLARALDGEWGIGSPVLDELEWRFALVQGLPACCSVVPVANGTVAIQLALEALDVGFGDEVVTTGWTWQATLDAVLSVNAVPVALDVVRDTWMISPELVEAYFVRCVASERPLPKALIVVDLYNRVCDMDRLVAICRAWRVPLIEDCAHAHGGQWNGRALGSFGAMGTFSTQSSKALASGEGGFVVTCVPVLDRRLRALVSCGRKVEESAIDSSAEVDELSAFWRELVDGLDLQAWPLQSGNYRMNAVTAALLLGQLERFPVLHPIRLATIERLENGLAEVEGVRLLAPQPEVTRGISYMYAFEFEPEAFAGMARDLFCEVLSDLLGGHFVLPGYDPLGGGARGYRSPVYNPQTKRRFNISSEHWKAIDPSRFELANVHAAFAVGITIMHPALCEPELVEAACAAIDWMREHATEIVAAAA